MKSLHEWRRIFENDGEDGPEMNWDRIRSFFTHRVTVDQDIFTRINSGSSLKSIIDSKQKEINDPKVLAEQLITAILKMVYGDESGQGRTVDPGMVGGSQPAPQQQPGQNMGDMGETPQP